MYCKECNKRLERDWSYCPACGAKVEEIKINLSNSTVLKEGTLRSLSYKSYSCRDVDLCHSVDCEDCIFGYEDIFTLEEIKERLIKEVVK